MLYLAKLVWTSREAKIIGSAFDYKLVNAKDKEEAKNKVMSIYKEDGKPNHVLIEDQL